MPDRSILVTEDGFEEDSEFPTYRHLWTCLNCGKERMVETESPPEEYSPNKEADINEPGTFPPPILRNPDDWEEGDLLTDAAKDLVIASWDMIDHFKGNPLIHKVGYIWRLINILESYKIEDIVEAARDYVEVI